MINIAATTCETQAKQLPLLIYGYKCVAGTNSHCHLVLSFRSSIILMNKPLTAILKNSGCITTSRATICLTEFHIAEGDCGEPHCCTDGLNKNNFKDQYNENSFLSLSLENENIENWLCCLFFLWALSFHKHL